MTELKINESEIWSDSDILHSCLEHYETGIYYSGKLSHGNHLIFCLDDCKANRWQTVFTFSKIIIAGMCTFAKTLSQVQLFMGVAVHCACTPTELTQQSHPNQWEGSDKLSEQGLIWQGLIVAWRIITSKCGGSVTVKMDGWTLRQSTSLTREASIHILCPAISQHNTTAPNP